MKMNVIFEDKMIVVDGVGRECALPEHDPAWHAIQWDGSVGIIDMLPGRGDRKVFATEAALAPYLAAWKAAAPKIKPSGPAPRVVHGAYLRAALAQMGHLDRVRKDLKDPAQLELFNSATSFVFSDAALTAEAKKLGIDLDQVFTIAQQIRSARNGG